MLNLLSICLFAAPASDWPQWMGPTRDNVWHDTGVLEKFPAGGPKVLWRSPLAIGYAGPAVAGGKVFVLDFVTTDKPPDEGNFRRAKQSGTERVLCFDAATGKELWKYEYPCTYAISYPNGPRCTPVVHQGKVYTLGAMGHLACLNASDGKPVWAKEIMKVYDTEPAIWGFAAHPVIDGDMLITLGGGHRDEKTVRENHVIALNKNTGEEIWKSQAQSSQGYSPVQFATIGGVRQLIVAGPDAVRGLDPATGKRFWSQPYNATSGSIIMTPVVHAEHCFVGGYNGKNLMLKLGIAEGKPTAETLWRNEKNLGISPVNVQPFLDDGILYGYSDNGYLIAMEFPSGKRLWSSGGPLAEKPLPSGTAFLVKNGNRFFSFTDQGDLVICSLSREGYKEIDRAKAIVAMTTTGFSRPVVWSMPAFADRKMFVRNDKEILCVDLAQ